MFQKIKNILKKSSSAPVTGSSTPAVAADQPSNAIPAVAAGDPAAHKATGALPVTSALAATNSPQTVAASPPVEGQQAALTPNTGEIPLSPVGYKEPVAPTKAIARQPATTSGIATAKTTSDEPKKIRTTKEIDKIVSQENLQAAMQANNDGVLCKKKGELEKSLAHYQRAIELYTQYAVAYFNRAILNASLGQNDLALADYNKAIELNPRDPEYYNNRGNLYARQEKFDQALSDYDQALHWSPNASEVYHNRAHLHVKRHEFDAGIEDFKRAIALNPDLVMDYFNLACLYALQGEMDQAFDFLEKAFRKGYKNIQQVRTDADLDKLRENPAFEDLMEMWNRQKVDAK